MLKLLKNQAPPDDPTAISATRKEGPRDGMSPHVHDGEHSISDPHYFDLQGLCRLRSYIIVHSMVIMTQIRVAAMLITPGLLVRVGRFPGRPGRLARPTAWHG